MGLELGRRCKCPVQDRTNQGERGLRKNQLEGHDGRNFEINAVVELERRRRSTEIRHLTHVHRNVRHSIRRQGCGAG